MKGPNGGPAESARALGFSEVGVFGDRGASAHGAPPPERAKADAGAAAAAIGAEVIRLLQFPSAQPQPAAGAYPMAAVAETDPPATASAAGLVPAGASLAAAPAQTAAPASATPAAIPAAIPAASFAAASPQAPAAPTPVAAPPAPSSPALAALQGLAEEAPSAPPPAAAQPLPSTPAAMTARPVGAARAPPPGAIAETAKAEDADTAHGAPAAPELPAEPPSELAARADAGRRAPARDGVSDASLVVYEDQGVMQVVAAAPGLTAADGGRLRKLAADLGAEFGMTMSDLYVNGVALEQSSLQVGGARRGSRTR